MDSENENKDGADQNIRVAVRCRPFNTREKNAGEVSCAKIYPDQVILTNPANAEDEHKFAFDVIFGEDCTQDEVWEQVGLPILKKAIAGYNGTIFAYGQTGSGKTWSMQGGEGELRGIIPRLNNHIFDTVEEEKESRPTTQFLVTVSYFEIYNEVIFDLLDATDRKKRPKGGLEIKEHPALGVYVKGLQELVVDSAGKLQSIVDQGMKNRTVASTQMNADSSRSHSVFIICIHQKDSEDTSKNVFAKVNLVDLAGSERVKSTGATGATLKEGANINKSLSALGNVINALVEAGKGKSTFIPYRNSKLTRVLQESLGGNSVTSMLAALSPAACNFEETLSTLKYANRAKAIKVKAIKNEEASQVSRLNDEIRMLREKLMSQHTVPGNDSGVVSGKNKERLVELEEALKSTWETKSKMSQEHEEERKRLLQEQLLAAQQLQAAKERSWQLLKDKANLELTFSHVREISKNSKSICKELDQWMVVLSKLGGLEKSLSDQSTVIQVFRTSLEKESGNLLKLFRANAENNNRKVDENQVINVLNQLQDKTGVILEEVNKWIQLRYNLEDLLCQLIYSTKSFFVYFQFNPDITDVEDGKVVETADMLRGVELALQQLRIKQNSVSNQCTATQNTISNYEFLILDMRGILDVYDAMVKLCATTTVNAGGASGTNSLATTGNFTIASNDQQEMQNMVKNVIGFVNKIHHKLAHQVKVAKANKRGTSATVNANGSGSSSSSTTGNIAPIHLDFKLDESCSSKYTVLKCLPIAEKKKDGKDSTNRRSTLKLESGQICWVSKLPDASDEENTESTSSLLHDQSIIVKLSEPASIHSVTLGGCQYSIDVLTESPSSALLPSGSVATIDGNNTYLASHRNSMDVLPTQPETVSMPSTARPPPTMSMQNIVLPCGLSWEDCNGSMENTSRMVGDLLDWTVILKKNPPEKFLKRPPVRFLFDLFQHLYQLYPNYLPPALGSMDWTVIGETKESKNDYMNILIDFVVRITGEQRVTSANSIITGAEPELTNKLLQQLALGVYLHKTTPAGISSSSASTTALFVPSSSASTMHLIAPTESNMDGDAAPLAIPLITKSIVCVSWIKSFRLWYSNDGQSWQSVSESEYVTGITSYDGSYTIQLDETFITNHPLISHVKIQPMAWYHNEYPNLCCAFRMDIQGIDMTYRDAQQKLPILLLDEQAVNSMFKDFQELIVKTLSFIQRLIELEKNERQRKQEEMKKNMELLAQEKALLAQTLASEKESLISNNLNLTEQLQKCFQQLQETTLLLEKEQQLNEELNKSRLQIEDEKATLQSQYQEKESEYHKLNTQFMKIEANYERECSINQDLLAEIAKKDSVQESLQDEIGIVMKAKHHLESEKEDLSHQILVLTEERDTARQHEEELFEKLTDVSYDLEKLQESYVMIADRCNDAQDEVDELRDQVINLQDALSIQKTTNNLIFAATTTTTTVATAAPAPTMPSLHLSAAPPLTAKLPDAANSPRKMSIPVVSQSTSVIPDEPKPVVVAVGAGSSKKSTAAKSLPLNGTEQKAMNQILLMSEDDTKHTVQQPMIAQAKVSAPPPIATPHTANTASTASSAAPTSNLSLSMSKRKSQESMDEYQDDYQDDYQADFDDDFED